ncbi:hypothetical protein [Peribacillus butanolivorans]
MLDICAELVNMLAVNIATSLTVDETIMDITLQPLLSVKYTALIK